MSKKTRKKRTTRNDTYQVSKWVQQLTNSQVAQIDALPLRRDMVTLLGYLRDHRVTGTQSTGNFPLKAVREVTACFVTPPVLDTAIGDRTYKLRSEDEVWHLQFLHTLACLGGLLNGGPSRRWQLTEAGGKFLTAIPPIQVWLMLATWWEQANWIMAYPFVGMGDRLPHRFEQVTLSHLLSLPVNSHVPFEPFADALIEKGGLTWTSQDKSCHRSLLHGAIQRMVINVLTDFGGVEPKYRDKPLGKGTIRELTTFCITPLGRGLLKSL
jgi:hypothetical protein